MPRQSARESSVKALPQLEDSWVVDADEDGDYIPPSSSLNLRSSKLTPGAIQSQKIMETSSTSHKKRSPKNPGSQHELHDALDEDTPKLSKPKNSGPSSSFSASNRKRSSRESWREVNSESNPPFRSASNIMAVSDDQNLESDDDLLESNGSSAEGLSANHASDVERSQIHASPSGKIRNRQSRARSWVSAEPDLIMPSIQGDNMDGSWVGEDKSSYKRGFSTASRMSTRPQARVKSNKLHTQSPANGASLDAEVTSLLEFLRPILSWVWDVMGGALGALKKPISYFLAIYLLVGLTILLRNLLTSSVYSALSPICRLPGASLLSLPMCGSGTAFHYEGSEPPPVQFDQLMKVQSNFEAILEESAGGVSLPLNMKRGEASIRDLRQVVRYSGLRSKNELVLEFDGFIETARIASYDLQKFNSHVGRGVDNILATARWTKRVLDGMAHPDGSRGTIAFFTTKLLAPFQPLKFTEDAVLDQYVQHTRIVEEEIHRLIAEAQALLLVLQNLEDRLDVMHGISVRDDVHAQTSRAEVLSQIWTMVGGNRGKIGRFDSQLRLLGQVNSYRQSAIAHVSGTMIKLQGMGAELEELRERVGGVELLGGKGGVPLSVHIENIELGVERLEKGRNQARGVENEELRKTLSGGPGEQRGIEEG